MTGKVAVLVGCAVAIGSALVGCGARALGGGGNEGGRGGASAAAGRGAAGAGGRGGMSGTGGGGGGVDYSCKAIPLTADDACPVAYAPKHGLGCFAQICTVCNSLRGVAGGQYLDINNELQTGYCICEAPSSGQAVVWSCASDTDWPCPLGAGCDATGGRDGGTGGSGFGRPICPDTALSGVPCLPDVQLCYRTCGPERIGVRSLTCNTSGNYNQMSGCSFDPSRDYSCYKIPSTANAACPTRDAPREGVSCDVNPCVPCNNTGGLPGGSFLDGSGAGKVGWCVCAPPSSIGLRTWSCASDVSWPCPAGTGC